MKGYMIYSKDGKEMLPARYERFIPSNPVKQTLLFKTEINAKERIRRELNYWKQELKYCNFWQNRPYDLSERIKYCNEFINKLNNAKVKEINSSDKGFYFVYPDGKISKTYKTKEKAQEVLDNEISSTKEWLNELKTTPYTVQLYHGGLIPWTPENEKQYRQKDIVSLEKRLTELESTKVIQLN